MRSKSKAAFVTRGLAIMAVVLFAVGSLLSIRDAGGPPSLMSAASANVERNVTTSSRYSSKPIRDIQPIAIRVLGENPERMARGCADAFVGTLDDEVQNLWRSRE